MKIWLPSILLLMTLHAAAQKDELLVRYKATDSVLTNISSKYEQRSFLHRLIMGKNYRKTWSTLVKLPVFHFSRSGYSIERLGGGEQTKSLYLADKNGKTWVLRTVDKNVEPAVPEFFKNNIGERIVQDMISASYPYSHTIVGKLAKTAGIKAPMAELYFVADDKTLGQHREFFANKVCSLEELSPVDTETIETADVKTKIAESNNNLILQKEVLKARLLDMLVGDWDRHDDQWRWAFRDSANLRYYFAIPRDRDNALFYSAGLLPRLTELTFMPHISGFEKKSKSLKNLSGKSLEFDKRFLNELDAADWEQTIKEFQQSVNDSAIEASVKTIPHPAYEQDAKEIVQKLKSRRDGLLKNAMKYYKFLAENINVEGSDNTELFVAAGKGKNLVITMYSLEKNSRKKIYERNFDPSETGMVQLTGLKGADHFVVEETAPSTIRLRIFGSEGKDVYEVRGNSKSRIVDFEHENNVVVNKASAKIDFR